MIPKDIYNHIKELKIIQQELNDLSTNSRTHGIEDYFNQIYRSKQRFQPGDRDAFFVPNYRLGIKLEKFQEKIDQKKFKTAFLTSKKELYSALSVYIRALEKGIDKLSKEHNNNI